MTRSRDYERLGCFKDSKDDRILGHQMVDPEQQSANVREPANNLPRHHCMGNTAVAMDKLTRHAGMGRLHTRM